MTTPAPTPADGPREITEVYGWVVVDTDGNESIASVHATEEIVMPLLSGDSSRLRRFIPRVRKAARDTGAPARLVRFVREEVVMEASPL